MLFCRHLPAVVIAPTKHSGVRAGLRWTALPHSVAPRAALARALLLLHGNYGFWFCVLLEVKCTCCIESCYPLECVVYARHCHLWGERARALLLLEYKSCVRQRTHIYKFFQI